MTGEKTSRQPTGWCKQNTHSNSMYRCASCVTTHTEQTWPHFITRTRVAQDCTSLCLTNGCHNTCHVSFLAAPDTDHKVLSHLPHLSFRHSLPRTQVLWRTMHIHPAKIHGRVADQHKSHLSHTQYQLTPRSKMKDAPSLLKIPNSECPDIWIRLPKHKWPKSWSSMEDPVVPLERNLYGPLTGLSWERQFGKVSLEQRLGKFQMVNVFFVHREKRDYSLSVHVNDIKLAGKKQNIDPMWKVLMKDVDLGEPTSFLDHVYLGCTQRECETSKDIVDSYRNMFEYKISAGAKEKLPCSGKPDADISSWSYDMDGHAKKCVERYCELAKKTTQQLYSSHNAMPWRPSIQRRRKWICWRIVKSMLSNGPEMFVLGTHWLTRHSMVSKQTGQEQSHKWTQSLLHNACFVWSLTFITQVNLNNIGHVDKHRTTMQTGTVSGLWCCRRSWRL